MFIDLDGFKAVNDRHGHAAGDRLLRRVAGCLTQVLRRTDGSARLGGDEFTLILEGLKRPQDAARVADKVIACLKTPFDLGDLEIGIGASLGIAIATGVDEDPELLIGRADAAMYRAKARGGTAYCLDTARMAIGESQPVRLSA